MNYHDAVVRALQAAYSNDTRVSVLSGARPDNSLAYTYVYDCGLYRDPGNQLSIPLGADLVAISLSFRLRPATDGSAPATVDAISAYQFVEWDSAREVTAWAEEALGRMWRCIIDGYLPVGEGFWEGFDALNRLSFTGLLPFGRFRLQGPGDNVVEVRVNRETWTQDFYNLGLAVEAQGLEGAAEPPGDWESMVAGLPTFGLGAEYFSEYSAGLASALAEYWASRHPQVSVNTTGATNLAEGWEETEFSWLHLPTSADTGYVLEALTLRFTPVDEKALEGQALPASRAVTVTERVAWEPLRYDGDPPAFEALVPARDLILAGYLPLGDGFGAAFRAVEISSDREARLPGADGTTIQLVVEDVADGNGISCRRYTLSWSSSTGG